MLRAREAVLLGITKVEKCKSKESKRLIASKRILITFSYVMILVIFANLTIFHSPLIGAIAFVSLLLVNGNFLGQLFFQEERSFVKRFLEMLLFIAFLGGAGWFVMILYNLDSLRVVIALLIVVSFVSFLSLKIKRTPWNYELQTPNLKGMHLPHILSGSLYLFLMATSFYLLFVSRSAEVHTVWQVIHPLFMPIFFAASLLLLKIIYSFEKTEYKLLFIIFHSILSHTFFAIIFPAGDVGYQALILGRTRNIFENLTFHGWPPWPVDNILSQVWLWCRGINFQASLSVIFARIFQIDVFWTHLLLVPVLWGFFVPVGMFMIAKTINRNENVSLLSALLVSSFPSTIYYGAISVPNCLGYVFFLYSLIFSLKLLSPSTSKTFFLAMTFSLAAFLSHFLTGIMAFSLFLLVIAVRKYENEKNRSPVEARLLLLCSFIFCTSLIPFALVYQKVFYPFSTSFSLEKLQGLPLEQVFRWIILGGYANYWIISGILHVMPPLLGFLGMIYYLKYSLRQRTNKKFLYSIFLLLSFLMVLIDYRITKFFMVGVPFNEERLWVFRDFLAVPFLAIIAGRFISLLRKKSSNLIQTIRFRPLLMLLKRVNLKTVATYILTLIAVSTYIIALLSIPAGVTISVYFGYPRYGPLQITSYELEAVKYIEENTKETYVVIADYWIIIAGQMLVGVHNPKSYYFRPTEPRGVAFFIEMKNNPTNETMIRAIKTNNATVAYFTIEKPRLSTEKYNQIIQQAQKNGVQTYKTLYYQGEEKLRVFYYKNSTST